MSITAQSLFGPLPEPDAERGHCEDCGRVAVYGVVLDDGKLARYCAVHLAIRAWRAVNR